MHKQLIIEVFKKAENELIQNGVQEPSKRQKAIHIETFLNEENIVLNERRLRDYYDEVKRHDNDFNIPQIRVVTGLCSYLGFNCYIDFETSVRVTEQANKVNTLRNRYQKFSSVKKFWVSIALILSIGFLGVLIGSFMFADKVRWMIWRNDHYEETKFEEDKLEQGIMGVYDEDKIQKFKKVNKPDCSYPYFDDDGSVNAWYHKNSEGIIEVFTELGTHPETGKTLKPITKYIIKKYLCPSY